LEVKDHEEAGDWDQGICSHETDIAEKWGEGGWGQGTCSQETGSVEVTRRLEVKVLVLVLALYICSTLLHLPPFIFCCVGGCWDQTQDCCDFGIGSQTL
jgi:hypothetical protein